MTVPMRQPIQGDIIESVITKGDLAKLTPQERTEYYVAVCKSMGLNPLTKPFEYITLNSKLQLYALRSCADQLRKINGVSLEIVSREIVDDILTIHVRAKLPDGRVDEDLGAAAFPSTLKGEARVNAELKAVTKAKRRATLSICGLGWLDETEVADIPAAAKRPVAAPNVMISQPEEIPATPDRGEAPAVEPPPHAPAAGALSWDDYVAKWKAIIEEARDARELHGLWNSEVHQTMRRQIDWPDDGGETLAKLRDAVAAKIAALKPDQRAD